MGISRFLGSGVLFLSVLIQSLTAQTITDWYYMRNIPSYWRIVTGRGGGVVLNATGLWINSPAVYDLGLGAEGLMELGSFAWCDCSGLHGEYQGTLFNRRRWQEWEGCGWGCVLYMPNSSSNAVDWVEESIHFIRSNLSSNLAERLEKIFAQMRLAVAENSQRRVITLGTTFTQEIRTFLLNNPISWELVLAIRGVSEYVTWAFQEMPVHSNVASLPPYLVQILALSGPAPHSDWRSVGSRLAQRSGQMLALRANASGADPVYRWTYRWSGARLGRIPDGVHAASLGDHIVLNSTKAGFVRVDLTIMRRGEPDAQARMFIKFRNTQSTIRSTAPPTRNPLPINVDAR
jgi:hypothetical protein